MHNSESLCSIPACQQFSPLPGGWGVGSGGGGMCARSTYFIMRVRSSVRVLVLAFICQRVRFVRANIVLCVHDI